MIFVANKLYSQIKIILTFVATIHSNQAIKTSSFFIPESAVKHIYIDFQKSFRILTNHCGLNAHCHSILILEISYLIFFYEFLIYSKSQPDVMPNSYGDCFCSIKVASSDIRYKNRLVPQVA